VDKIPASLRTRYGYKISRETNVSLIKKSRFVEGVGFGFKLNITDKTIRKTGEKRKKDKLKIYVHSSTYALCDHFNFQDMDLYLISDRGDYFIIAKEKEQA